MLPSQLWTNAWSSGTTLILEDWEVVAVQRVLEDLRTGNLVCDLLLALLVSHSILTFLLSRKETPCLVG